MISSLCQQIEIRLLNKLLSHNHFNIGQYHDDTRTSSSRIQQEQHDLDSDEDNYEKSTMFQANYQYTPLKDYAASKSQLTNYPSEKI